MLEGLCVLGIGLGTYAHVTITPLASGQVLEVFFKAKDADKLGEGGRYHQGLNLGTCRNPTQSLAPIIETSSCVSAAESGPDSSLGNCTGFKAKSVYEFFTQFILPATCKGHPRLQSALSLLTPTHASASA